MPHDPSDPAHRSALRRAAFARIRVAALFGGLAIGTSHWLRHDRALAAVGYGMLAAVLGLALGTVLIAVAVGADTHEAEHDAERRWSIALGVGAIVVAGVMLYRYF